MGEGCLHNANVASIQIGRTQDELRGLEPGMNRTLLQRALSNYRAEYEHWSTYVAYYRQRIAKEGPDVRPTIFAPQSKTAERPRQTYQPKPHWSEPRPSKDEDFVPPVANQPTEITNDEVPF